MNEIATREPGRITVREQSPLLVPDMFGAMWRLAEAMANASTIPQPFQKKPGDCLRVVELAHRCGQSPFALIDHCFVTSGKFALDGQGMAGLINSSPKIEGNLRYEYAGEGRTRRVTVRGRLAGEAEERSVTATVEQGLADSKGARARWESDPDQMLAYYGARRWARRHAPEVTMGLYTRDELRAAFDGKGPVIDVTPDDEPETAAGPAAPAPRRSTADWWDGPSLEIPPNGGGWQKWCGRMTNALTAAPDVPRLYRLMDDNQKHLKNLDTDNRRAAETLHALFGAREADLAGDGDDPETGEPAEVPAGDAGNTAPEPA